MLRKKKQTELLIEAKRRLKIHNALCGSADGVSETAKDVTCLIEKRKREAKKVQVSSRIEKRAIGIWIGVTFELAIHTFISCMETSTLDAYSSDESHDHGYEYSGDYYDTSATRCSNTANHVCN